MGRMVSGLAPSFVDEVKEKIKAAISKGNDFNSPLEVGGRMLVAKEKFSGTVQVGKVEFEGNEYLLLQQV